METLKIEDRCDGDDRVAAALEYVNRGWAVVPMATLDERGQCCTCEKGRSCTTPGNHPVLLFKDGAMGIQDPELVRMLSEGKCGIGIALRASGLLVVRQPTKLVRGSGLAHELPPCPVANLRTSLDHYFRAPEGLSGNTRIGGWQILMDTSVLAPPSRVPPGIATNWNVSVEEVNVPEAPSWMVDLIRGGKGEKRSRVVVPLSGMQEDESEAPVVPAWTSVASSQGQAAEIQRVLQVLMDPTEILELRILKTNQGTVSGYFNDRGACAAAAGSWSGKVPGVYVTLNPVQPSLLARAANHTKPYVRDTTADNDIVWRRWLLIDFDPKRASGISSTEDEHQAALACARKARAWLVRQGLALESFILADSGNGAHLLLRIDLPNDKASNTLAKACLGAVELWCGEEAVEVDQTTSNAARICKLYGTLAAKGDSTEDRPHRMANLLEVPDNIVVASVGQLEKLAQYGKTKAGDRVPSENGTFDVEAWLEKHQVPVVRTKPWNDGQIWILNPCPWNPDHDNDAAFIVRQGNGALSAGCHHNGCAGNDWHALRDLYEPDCADRAMAGDTERAPKAGGSIVVNRQMDVVLTDGWEAVCLANEPPELFRRSGQLVRLVDDGTGTPAVGAVGDAALQDRLSRAADWIQTSTRGPIPTYPPKPVVQAMAATPDPRLPELTGVLQTPIFGQAGNLLMRAGYHPADQVWLAPPSSLSGLGVPPDPTDTEIHAARDLLLNDLLVDFQFTSDAERAHAVALLLLPFVRRMLDSPTPLHIIEASTPGTGKSLLADVVGLITTGESIPVYTLPHKDEEVRKKITSILMTAPPLILLDNVGHMLASADLAAALTADPWADRLLGKSETVRLPNKAVWMATANNPEMSSELARRGVRIRIEAGGAEPWKRTGFRHEPLRVWVREERARLVTGCLTIVQGWIAGGRVRSNANLGSFEDWAAVMGGILEHAHIPGFLGNLDEQFTTVDVDSHEWLALCEEWWHTVQGSPVPAGTILVMAKQLGLFDTVLGVGNERAQAIRMGRHLGKQRGRFFGPYQIKVHPTRSHTSYTLHQNVTAGTTPAEESALPNGPPSEQHVPIDLDQWREHEDRVRAQFRRAA